MVSAGVDVRPAYDPAQTIAWPCIVKPSVEPQVLSQPWVAVSNVPNRRISGEIHFFFVTAMDTLRER